MSDDWENMLDEEFVVEDDEKKDDEIIDKAQSF